MQSKLIECFSSIEEPDAVSAKITSLNCQNINKLLIDKLKNIYSSIKNAAKEGKEFINFNIPISISEDIVNQIICKLQDKKYKVNLTTDNTSFLMKISWDHIDLEEE